MKKPNMMVTGMAILKDLERNTYMETPKAKQNMAVLVPEANIVHVHARPVMKKNIRSFPQMLLCDTETMKNATALAAMLHPKLAASLNMEKYLVMPFTMWVRAPYTSHAFSMLVKPMCCCFHAQKAAKSDRAAHSLRNVVTRFGVDMYMMHTR